jgi:hypothetical protein
MCGEWIGDDGARCVTMPANANLFAAISANIGSYSDGKPAHPAVSEYAVNRPEDVLARREFLFTAHKMKGCRPWTLDIG